VPQALNKKKMKAHLLKSSSGLRTWINNNAAACETEYLSKEEVEKRIRENEN
jgi:hypothetical protein